MMGQGAARAAWVQSYREAADKPGASARQFLSSGCTTQACSTLAGPGAKAVFAPSGLPQLLVLSPGPLRRPHTFALLLG